MLSFIQKIKKSGRKTSVATVRIPDQDGSSRDTSQNPILHLWVVTEQPILLRRFLIKLNDPEVLFWQSQ